MNVSDHDLDAYGSSFLQSFEAIRRALQLYPGSHPKVAEQLDRFVRNLASVHRDLGQATFNVIAREFYMNGLPLKRMSITYAKAMETWDGLGLGLVRFAAETTPADALGFFEMLGKSKEEIAEAGGIARMLVDSGCRSIVVTGVSEELGGALLSVFDQPSIEADSVSRSSVARSRYADSKALLGSLIESARGTSSTSGRVLRTAATLLLERVTEREPVADLLERLREHHERSWRHAIDGAIVAVLMGRELGLPLHTLQLLMEAAALRDIGKVAVSSEALDATETSAAAKAEYLRHPAEGAKLLLDTPQIDASAAIVALEHHAGFDGRGFPALRARRGLHPYSRVVAVASAYDRLAGARAGEAALQLAEALRRLVQGAGSTYDPAAVRALVSLIGLVPEATAVKLRDGSYGVVGPPGSDWSEPDVMLLKDAHGRDLPPRAARVSARPDGDVVATSIPTREDGARLKPFL